MSDVAQLSFRVSSGATGVKRMSWVIAWSALVALSLVFIFRNALHYYMDQSNASFGRYAAYRLPLLLHITGGMTALLTGPLQFWMGYRRKPMQVHRWA